MHGLRRGGETLRTGSGPPELPSSLRPDRVLSGTTARVVHLATRHPCGKQGVGQPHREEGPGELGLQGAGLGVGVRMDGWARLLGVGDGLLINERSPSSIPPLSRFLPAPPKLDFEASREKLQKLGEDDNSGSLSK